MASVKNWIVAFRLRTLNLAISGWLVGTFLAAHEGVLDCLVSLGTLLTAILLQILSNLANDYGDAVSGVDSDLRKGPNRMVQIGAISKEAIGKAIIVFSTLALISGASLLAVAFPGDWAYTIAFFLIGLIGVAAAIRYTVGKNPYGYAGFGDLFVFVFFGLVLVSGTYFLQTNVFSWTILLPASSIGCFSVGVLNVNNIRDIESDRGSGKYSIPVRIGKSKAVLYHIFLLEGGILLSIVFVLLQFRSPWQFLFALVNFIFMSNIKAVGSKPSDQLDPYLKQMAISTLLFSILFSMGQLLSGFL